jgi:hypothetical protein
MLAFKILGIILFVYIGWAAWCGTVFARRGIGWNWVERATRPRMSWAVLACHVLLGAALLTVF